MDHVPTPMGKAHIEPLQQNVFADYERVQPQEGLHQRHPPHSPLPALPSLSASNLAGITQQGGNPPNPLRQMPYQATSPRAAGWPHADEEERDMDIVDQGRGRQSRSQPPHSRSRSYSRPPMTASSSAFEIPPLPQPSQNFTINVQPGPNGQGHSISISNGSQSGQRDDYPQSVIETNQAPTPRNYFPFPNHSMEKMNNSASSQGTLKNPFTTVKEIDSDLDSVASGRQQQFSTAKGFTNAQPPYNMRPRYLGEEEDGKGFNFPGNELLESKEIRHEYLLRLARALILFGAPPHRLEEYLIEASGALGIRGQFIYYQGIMTCSFDEIAGGKDGRYIESGADVKIVREKEGVDMDKLDDLRHVFKEVKAGRMPCQEGVEKVNALLSRAPQNNTVIMLIAYGFASVFVGTFAFESRPIDLPIQFILGLVTGTLHVIVTQYAPFAIVFEVLCPLITSFLARGLGSINGGKTFCFSALAQTAIVLILPGYVMMMAMLELQGKKVASGVIRAGQALLYTMFLALGMTIGSALYGAFDKNASIATRCQGAGDLPVYYRFIGATCFSLALSTTMQIKWKQCPIAVAIALFGFTVNYLGSTVFPKTPQIFNVIASFAIGVCGNLYARLGHGLAVGIIMPALTIQVPSAMAASAALLSGLEDASLIHNITQGANQGTSQLDPAYHETIDQVVYTAGISIAELGVAIAIGLFLANMACYPMGIKKRGGLFGH